MNAEITDKVNAYLTRQDFTQAIQLVQQAVKDQPEDAGLVELYGDVFAKMENWTKAEEQYEKAILLSAVDAPIYAKLGLVACVKEDYNVAYGHYLSASKLDPSNPDYLGKAGAMNYTYGSSISNMNLMADGFANMKRAISSGSADSLLKEILCLAYLDQTFQTWVTDPENKEDKLPTENKHIEDARNSLREAKLLADSSNIVVARRINDTEQLLNDLEKKKFIGSNYLIKAPIIIGLVLFIFVSKTLGGLVLLMALLYYFSQMAPGYKVNKLILKGTRDPLIIRRLNAISKQFEGITFFGSLGDVLFRRFLFSFVISTVMYVSAVMMLPFEIVRGFMSNYR